MKVLKSIGNCSLLKRKKTLFICSKHTPDSCYKRIFDWVESLCEQDCIVCFNSTELEEEVAKALVVRKIPTILIVMDFFSDVNNSQMKLAQEEGRMLVLVLERDEPKDMGPTPRLRNEYALNIVQKVVCGYVNKNGTVYGLVNPRNDVEYLLENIPLKAAEESVKHYRWSVGEDKKLMEMYYADMGLHAITKRLNRSYHSVKMRIRSITSSDEAIKGREFEDYVLELFNLKNNKSFTLTEWQGDKMFGDICPEGNKNPDLIMRYNEGDVSIDFAIECKWRKVIGKNLRTTVFPNEKMDIYRQYNKERNMPVYIILGVGGEPSSPYLIYLFRLEDITAVLDKKVSIINFLLAKPDKVLVPEDFYDLLSNIPKAEMIQLALDEDVKTRNAYKQWNDKADNLLRKFFKKGLSTKELSELFGRTNGAIVSRLKKLGIEK